MLIFYSTIKILLLYYIYKDFFLLLLEFCEYWTLLYHIVFNLFINELPILLNSFFFSTFNYKITSF